MALSQSPSLVGIVAGTGPGKSPIPSYTAAFRPRNGQGHVGLRSRLFCSCINTQRHKCVHNRMHARLGLFKSLWKTRERGWHWGAAGSATTCSAGRLTLERWFKS